MSQIHLKFTSALLVIASVLASSSSFASVTKNCSDVFLGDAKPVMSISRFDATAELRRISDELAEDMHPMDKVEVLAKALDATSYFTAESQIFQLWTSVIEATVQTRLRDEQIGELQMKLAQHLEQLPSEKLVSGAKMLLRDWQPKAGGKAKKPVLTEGMINARIVAVTAIAKADAAESKKFFEVAILRDPKNTPETLLYGVEGMLDAIYKYWPRRTPRQFADQLLVNEVHSSSMKVLAGGDLYHYIERRNLLEAVRERQPDER